MSAFISYPDKIVATGEMTGDYPPIEHVNKVAGVIDEIYVKDGESVEKDATVVYIENTMNRSHQLLFREFQASLMKSGVFRQMGTLETEIKKTKELSYTLEMEKMFAAHELELIEKDMGRNKYLQSLSFWY